MCKCHIINTSYDEKVEHTDYMNILFFVYGYWIIAGKNTLNKQKCVLVGGSNALLLSQHCFKFFYVIIANTVFAWWNHNKSWRVI